MRLLIFICLLCFSTVLAAQANFSVNPLESHCQWTGSAAVGLYNLEGTLEVGSGELLVNGDSLLEANLEIDMKSLATDNKTVKKHLKGKDFFDVSIYRTANFSLEKPLLFKDGPGIVRGMIEIKGVKRSIEVPMEVKRTKKKVELSGVLVLDRTEFGITYNSSNFFEDLGEQAISDEIEFHFHLVFE